MSSDDDFCSPPPKTSKIVPTKSTVSNFLVVKAWPEPETPAKADLSLL